MSIGQNTQENYVPFSSTQNNDISYQTHCLLAASHRFVEQTTGIVSFLCKEVERISKGSGHLCIYGSSCPVRLEKLPIASFHVTCNRIEYGSLICFSSPSISQEDLFLRDMQTLAVACATILYMLEQTRLVCRQDHSYELKRCALLSKKEREVLACMGCGLNKEEIAVTLAIRPTTVKTHRQHIFEKLSVHNDNDAIIMGYSAGLFSPIAHISRPEPDWSAMSIAHANMIRRT